MTEILINRVKNSLKSQCYTMNDSWLTDCVEFYLNDHENAKQEEIVTFVMNQWVLSDLREINNETGCLPKDLAQKKCMTLSGKYILQMDKIYDISISKYKQLEKIRNVSIENVEATENENTAQEDKFQAWEPKSKRMLQLSLTDGVQDVFAIEYKPIRFLKDSLYPGYKLLIKGPVICRKGVILLEESNIVEVGGEVESLLIANAVENVFARALNLEENPDPYNDNNKKTENTQGTQSTLRSVMIEDDFDIDTQKIEQIEKQAQQYSSNSSKISNISVTRNVPGHTSAVNNNLNNQESQTIRNQQLNFKNNSNTNRSTTQKQSYNYNNQKTANNFEDEDDTFLEMVDEKAFDNLPISKPSTVVQANSISNKTASSLQTNQNENDEFPMDDEMYDLSEERSTFFTSSTSCNVPSKLKSNIFDKPSSSKSSSSFVNTESKSENKKLEQLSALKNESKQIFKNESNSKNALSKLPSSKPVTNTTSSVSNFSEFPDDDFDFNDFEIKTEEFNDNINKNKTVTSNIKLSQASSSSSSKLKNSVNKGESSSNQFISNKSSTNSSNETKFEGYNSLDSFGNEFDDEFDVDYMMKKNRSLISTVDKTEKTSILKSEVTASVKSQKQVDNMSSKITASVKSQKQVDNISSEITGIKRPASTLSPLTDTPPKFRCVESSPKINKTANRKITDFLTNESLIPENSFKVYEFICDVIKQPLKDDKFCTVVRGKVVNIIKLNLLKDEKGSYFHLEGTITDGTANLDIVFSSEVLEKIIGYNSHEFIQKRKKSKNNPAIKDQLRDDLKQAQETLKFMDALMEIVMKKNEKPLVVNTTNLSKSQKKALDERVASLKK